MKNGKITKWMVDEFSVEGLLLKAIETFVY